MFQLIDEDNKFIFDLNRLENVSSLSLEWWGEFHGVVVRNRYIEDPFFFVFYFYFRWQGRVIFGFSNYCTIGKNHFKTLLFLTKNL